jgi:RNA polymerase sigma-70 factor, ECF subfamily
MMRRQREGSSGSLDSESAGTVVDLIDTSLVLHAQVGDESAMARLLCLSRPVVERMAGRWGGRDDLVEDLTQATLLIVLTQVGSLRCPEAFIGWLQGIVRNVCRKELRRREAARVAATRLAQHSITAPTSIVDPLEAALRLEVRAHLESALRGLPRRYQVVIIMRALEGRTYTEIGEALDVPGRLARLWYFRARQRLQDACTSDEVLVRASSPPISDFLIELTSNTFRRTEPRPFIDPVADRVHVACGAA